MRYEFFCYRVCVHVLQLFPELFAGVHVEVVIAALPEAAKIGVAIRGLACELLDRFALVATHGTGNSLLEDLHYRRGEERSGLFDYEMDVLGHDYVAYETKPVFGTDLGQDLDGEIAGMGRFEEFATLVAAEGDEVKVAVAG